MVYTSSFTCIYIALCSWAGLSKAAAEWLANHGHNNSHATGIVGVGIDTLSLDKGQAVRMMAHIALFAANIYGIENVANLDKVSKHSSRERKLVRVCASLEWALTLGSWQ